MASDPVAPAAPRPRRRRLLRWIFRLACGALVLAVFLALVGWYHYSTTPTFDEWVAQRPVDDTWWRERVPAELEPLADVGFFGLVDPLDEAAVGELEVKRLEFVLDLARPDGPLAERRVDVVAALDPETGDLRGLALDVHPGATDERFREVVVVSIDGPPDETWGEQRASVEATVDVFVLAGAGPPELWVARGPAAEARAGRLSGLNIGGPLFRMVTTLFDGPPPEGIAYHAREGSPLDWRVYEGGYGGPGLRFPAFRTTDDEYSWEVTLNARDGSGGLEVFVHRTITWGDWTW